MLSGLWKKKNQKFDAVMLLQPTNPLRTVHDIDGAIGLLADSECDSVISLVKVEDHHPARMKLIDSNGYVSEPPYAAKKFDQPRQAFPDIYLRNGAIYLSKTDLIRDKGRLMVINVNLGLSQGKGQLTLMTYSMFFL